MNEIDIQYRMTPLGEMILGSYASTLCLCDWRYRRARASIDRRLMQGAQAIYIERDNDVLVTAFSQLQEYFLRKRKHFDIPLTLMGTPFQQQVWKALTQIPYGETASYTELAMRVKNNQAIRAVAAANGANALSILIPCHRIIGANGALTGYAGGLKAKQQLLDLEQENFVQNSLF